MLFRALAVSLALLPSLAHADPFLWLEEVESPKALEWVDQKNASTLGKIQSRSDFAALEKELLSIYTSQSRLPGISLRNGFVYNLWQDQQNPRGLWRRTSLENYKASENPQWETLLDLDALGRAEGKNWVWKSSNCLEPEGTLCLISLSRGGGDAAEVREFDVAKKEFVTGGFLVPEARNDISWLDKDTLLLGTNFGPGSVSKSGYPLVVKKWKRGTPLAQAQEMFRGHPDDMLATGFVSVQPGWQPEIYGRYLNFYTTEWSVAQEDGKLVRIPLPKDAKLQTTIGAKAFFILQSELKAGKATFTQGSLVAYPLLRAAEGEASLESLELVFQPSQKRFLEGVNRSGNDLLLNVLDNVSGKVLRAQRGGFGWRLLEIRMGDNGMAEVTSSDAYTDAFLATYKDFLTPTTQFVGSTKALKTEKLRSSPAYFDTSGMTAQQFEATSKDGTKIPYFIVYRKGMALDGKNPALLYGYGGFNVSMTPWYSGTVGKSWLEKGGVLVVASIRGGGEFGPAWHEAAMKENKQRSYDDFIAVAESVIARKITSPAHLGIQGGSNGGLLVGAVMVQRPDLFNAVLCEVPLLDMMRYHLLLAGHSWVGEYGNPEIPAEREFILKYSPYQNVKAGVKYPEVFFTTSTRDDRVHPGHARKMAALLESLGNTVFYYENREGGHGGAVTPEQTARMQALAYSYLWLKLAR